MGCGAPAGLLAAETVGRFPRASPEPRVVPKAPAGGAAGAAAVGAVGGVGRFACSAAGLALSVTAGEAAGKSAAASSGAPDLSVSGILCVGCREGGSAGASFPGMARGARKSGRLVEHPERSKRSTRAGRRQHRSGPTSWQVASSRRPLGSTRLPLASPESGAKPRRHGQTRGDFQDAGFT